MSTHMRKVEVITIMRCLASKHSELGAHEKALNYISRGEDLASKLLGEKDHI